MAQILNAEQLFEQGVRDITLTVVPVQVHLTRRIRFGLWLIALGVRITGMRFVLEKERDDVRL